MLSVAGNWVSVLTKLIPLATGYRALTDHCHSGGAGPARAAAEARQPRLPRRLGAGPGRAHRGVRRGLRPARRSAPGAAEVGVLGARGAGVGADRFRRLHLADPASRTARPRRWLRSFSKLTPVRAGVTGAVLVALRPEVLILCAAAGLADRYRRAERRGRLDVRPRVRRRLRIDGRHPHLGVYRCRRPPRRRAGTAQSLDGRKPCRDDGGHLGRDRLDGCFTTEFTLCSYL